MFTTPTVGFAAHPRPCARPVRGYRKYLVQILDTGRWVVYIMDMEATANRPEWVQATNGGK